VADGTAGGFNGGAGANNVVTFEFCLALGNSNGFSSGVAINCYHCVAWGCTNGFNNNSKGGVFQNCAAHFNVTDYNAVTNGTFTKCSSSDTTGSEAGLRSLTPAQLDFWGQGNNLGFFSCGGADFRILTTSALFDAGTYSASYQLDIDGNAITDGHAPIGCHVGTAKAYGVSWPAANKVLDEGTSNDFISFDGAQTASYAPDLPDVGNVRDTDTVGGSAGTLSSDKVLKSNTTPGNYNDDNLSVGNIRPVAFGLSQTGTLANLAASDAAYVSLEATRNDPDGITDADIADGVDPKILNVQYTGSAVDRDIATIFADIYASDLSGNRAARFTTANTMRAAGSLQFNAALTGATVSAQISSATVTTPIELMDAVPWDFASETTYTLKTINDGTDPESALSTFGAAEDIELRVTVLHDDLPDGHLTIIVLFATVNEGGDESSASESSLSESSASGGGDESSTSSSTSTSTSSSTSSSTEVASSSSSSESGPGDFTVNEYEDFLRDEGDQVTIERKSLTVTDTGARKASYATVDTVFASIQPASSNDRAPFERRGIFVTHKVFVAENPGITEGDRIGRYGTSIKYLVHGVKDVQDRGELYVLYCEEMKVSAS
jgi:head-tail adaptor